MNPDITLPKPKKIKQYAGKITQTGTNAPTVTTLFNTTGLTMIWTRDGVGLYRGTFSEEIDPDKTGCYIQTNALAAKLLANVFDPTYIRIISQASGQVFTDGLLDNTYFTITIYDL